VVTSTRKLEWFSSYHTALMLLSMVLFPLISRHRKLCPYWYVRPPEPTGGETRSDLEKQP
jgi:hypothetical protein